MAPKKEETSQSPPSVSDGMFSGMFVFLVDSGVQPRRLQIWKQRLEQMGAKIEDYFSKRVTHIFAMNWNALKQKIDSDRLSNFKGIILVYQWLEDSLRLGEKASQDIYILKDEASGEACHQSSGDVSSHGNGYSSGNEELPHHKKQKISSPEKPKDPTLSLPVDSRHSSAESKGTATSDELHEESLTSRNYDLSSSYLESQTANFNVAENPDKVSTYNPPDLNKNITDIFKKLIDIYRALGEDRRSFSYYKAIPVIEKLPFKIENAEQVKHLPGIGKSLCDHIQEIVSTGKMSKLEHFENDERVKTISLFGEVWGVGPATALKLYDKGHRTLEDLKNDASLTNAQKLGLQYFDDIKTRIPRHEVTEMEKLLQKVGEEVLPGVVIVCGGSYRRGKSSCGDMDIVITHPDGQSHKGFLAKFVKRLKDMNFLREDLVFSTHSEEGTDHGVDTYFGLCTYPGRELRHRIDLKVYPKNIYPFGLIAWTGNDTLNRRLRLLAESKGYRLDDTGLFLSTPGSGGKRGSRGTASLHFDTEKQVFDFLEFQWLEPHERNL
ncbi:DNA polymerase lambda isoform X2 [Amaranthus tricolor]|uniref:DNA polymerase lambda isoform X2 n=1 Tax=Amaranthus tricolor TaxID=29722 RepID=UPI00258B61C9|nr:DNA polymerase lambda isoform X2 [Amaranthus tricolor]